MRDTRLSMGMPVTVEVADESATAETLEDVFSFFESVDERMSTYKPDSEISRINRGELSPGEYSQDMRDIFALAEKTKRETDGYFDIRTPAGTLDPSGIVKGWAIREAASRLKAAGHENFFVDAGGDVASQGVNRAGEPWSVGIRNPFSRDEIVKVIYPRGQGVATSGNYIRGNHIYDPHAPGKAPDELVSLTVVGPDVLEADRFATAAFAMGKKGLAFIANLSGFEGYGITPDKVATMTDGWNALAIP
ncbi:MAG: FAD:protein FMN transferase [Patescibacteria group bacterium]|nr:FAD:protein FMN transferase [Patescibacteria group bacterium]MDE1965671.1 FAD:protein FMN transferase [Patescibacteria group bacterium]